MYRRPYRPSLRMSESSGTRPQPAGVPEARHEAGIYEVVLQTVDPARRDEYVGVFKGAFAEAAFAGWSGGKILRGIEDPARVVVIVEWGSVEAHTQHIGTPALARLRERTARYQTAPSVAAHYLAEDL